MNFVKPASIVFVLAIGAAAVAVSANAQQPTPLPHVPIGLPLQAPGRWSQLGTLRAVVVRRWRIRTQLKFLSILARITLRGPVDPYRGVWISSPPRLRRLQHREIHTGVPVCPLLPLRRNSPPKSGLRFDICARTMTLLRACMSVRQQWIYGNAGTREISTIRKHRTCLLRRLP